MVERKKQTKNSGKKKSIKKQGNVKKIAPKKRVVNRKKMSVPKKIGGMRTAAFGYLITGIFELVMSLPFIGRLIGMGSFGMMWLIGIIINIIVIIVLINRKKPTYANIIAIIANVLGVVPILGWFLHLMSTILLFILFFREEKNNC